jgi:transcriptional regulator with XRE-family HTH domain
MAFENDQPAPRKGRNRDARRKTPFGCWLESALDEKGWTMAEFSRRTDIAEATISAWVRGTRNVSMKHLPTIATALDVSVDTVFAAIGPTTGSSKDRIAAWLASTPSEDELQFLSADDLARLNMRAWRLVHDMSHIMLSRRKPPPLPEPPEEENAG